MSNRTPSASRPAARLVVGISGLNAVDNPGPGVGVARSLRERESLNQKGFECEIVGLAYNALEPGIYMDWVVDRSFTLPYPSSGTEDYLARLAHIQAETGMNCIIPCLDAELPLYIRFQDELARLGIRTFLPTMSQFRWRSKDQLAELADKGGLSYPKTRAVSNEVELCRAVDELGLPVMVKGIFYDARKVFTLSDAVANYRRLLAEWGGPVLVQQIVTGDELNVVGVGDGTGGLLGMVAAKKTYVTALGKMWGGVTVRHAGVLDAAERFVKACRWRGPFELECIVEDERVHLIEINPRFPAWVYLATGVGVNLPGRLIDQMFGRATETDSDYDAGRLFLRYSYDMIAPLERFQKTLTTGQTP
jgi:carbamoyl-phosphate synthase large subunit